MARKSRKPKGARKPVRITDGSVYVLEIWIGPRGNEVKVYKIGVTASTVPRRMLGILESFYASYGYVPRCRVLHWENTKNYYAVEAAIHKVLECSRYDSEYAFNGYTELFKGLNEEDVLAAYRSVIDLDADADSEDHVNEW